MKFENLNWKHIRVRAINKMPLLSLSLSLSHAYKTWNHLHSCIFFQIRKNPFYLSHLIWISKCPPQNRSPENEGPTPYRTRNTESWTILIPISQGPFPKQHLILRLLMKICCSDFWDEIAVTWKVLCRRCNRSERNHRGTVKRRTKRRSLGKFFSLNDFSLDIEDLFAYNLLIIISLKKYQM